MTINKQILVINAGSSSIKFATYEATDPVQLSLSGQVKNIKTAPVLKVVNAKREKISEMHFPAKADYQYFFDLLLSRISGNENQIVAIGHRVAHGGPKYHHPTIISQQVLADLKELIPFVPLHQPYNIEGIETIRQAFPDLPQIACFDTAFHRTHPPIADYFGIPRAYTQAGIRRYGFHGLSYEYIMSRLQLDAPEKANGKLIIAHLGSGASLCAVKEGKSIDSTMGFSALDGLLMGTRCGSLDPGVLLYLMQFKNMQYAQIQKLLYEQSGLLGVSNISNDMQVLLESKHPHAQEAIDLFIYRLQKELGALSASLKGLEMLIFTGGIGERSAIIRELACQNMQWLGIDIDLEKNHQHQTIISKPHQAVEVRVMPTDEEKTLAMHTYTLLTNLSEK